MSIALIKRYPNRRLYDKEKSKYITLDDLAEDLSAGRRVKICEHKTGEDITKRIMLQALLTEQHIHKISCLPQDFLQMLLQLEDPSMRSLFEHYVRVTLSSFSMAQSAMQNNLELLKKLAPNPTELISNLPGISDLQSLKSFSQLPSISDLPAIADLTTLKSLTGISEIASGITSGITGILGGKKDEAEEGHNAEDISTDARTNASEQSPLYSSQDPKQKTSRPKPKYRIHKKKNT